MADFVVLSADLTRVAPNAIKDIHVEKTVIGGRAARANPGLSSDKHSQIQRGCGHSVVICVLEMAVLKPPHSKRWRACLASTNLATRLDCGAFTAAFPRRAAVAKSSRSTPERE